MSVALELRYLFGVHFADGSEYFQTDEDVSLENPKRSAYYDICLHGPDGDLLVDSDEHAITRPDIEIFQIQGQRHLYLVDLRDGHFEIDGIPFFLDAPPTGSSALRLVYFRRRRHHFQGGREIGQECEYHFGWKTGDGKEAVTRTIGVI